jgi:hypothetical protein
VRYCALCGKSSDEVTGISCINCGRWVCEKCEEINKYCLCQKELKKICLNCSNVDKMYGCIYICKEIDRIGNVVKEVMPLMSGCKEWKAKILNR